MLLSGFAKLLERIVLKRMGGMIELRETQFGGRLKRGVYDAMSNVLQFLKDCHGMQRLVISMDMEGSFDKLDRGLQKDILVARGCAPYIVEWVGRWCEHRVVRFKFNDRISRDYHVGKGITQGSPLSLTLFVTYIADIMEPQIR